MEIRPFDSKGTEWLFQWEELKRINTLSTAEERKKTQIFFFGVLTEVRERLKSYDLWLTWKNMERNNYRMVSSLLTVFYLSTPISENIKLCLN